MKSINNFAAIISRASIIAVFLVLPLLVVRAGTQIDITGPAGSSISFGSSVTALPNGNIVIVDQSIGDVYLYNGTNGVMISVLRADASSRITILSNGNYVVVSPSWQANLGAVTFCHKTTGCSGTVSPLNSLVGGTSGDRVGFYGITVLPNGNYLVNSPRWNGERGAITWGNGITGVSGAVSVVNSLVGAMPGDRVGSGSNGLNGISALDNGNYVVISSAWNNNRGAATFCVGTAGCVGNISSANSLVGTSPLDSVGSDGVKKLTNGNYVVGSSFWDNGAASNAGAVSWGSGIIGVVGEVSASNSIVGSNMEDRIGAITALSNGNYVVTSRSWNGYRGAATFGDGASGTSGIVSPANSLTGNNPSDTVGEYVIVLTNGNYIVRSPNCLINGKTGAVTFANGTMGLSGAVSQFNSFIGAGDKGVTALTNGNYVVRTNNWNASTGAVTWADGTTGIVGTISASNSLVGSSSGDRIGEDDVTPLANGNYVVSSSDWDNGSLVNAGAVTFGNGTTGTVGVVSPTNSLVGTHSRDELGSVGVLALQNGNYVVRSPEWNGYRGAATFSNGVTGITGEVSAQNSLVGGNPNDYVGTTTPILANGNYVVVSQSWNEARGAVTFGNAANGISGIISAANSLVGSNPGDRIGNGNNGAGITPLTEGSYVVNSGNWSDGRGSATYANGNTGIVGVVSSLNSLVGNVQNDGIGSYVIAFSSGNYAVFSPNWDNGSIVNAGAVSLGKSNAPLIGAITADNSVRGTFPNYGSTLVVDYDTFNSQFVVGRSGSKIVTLFRYENRQTLFDFDGDGKSDISLFRPSNGVWYLQQSTAGFNGVAFGTSDDLITPADYDSDGKTDIAVFRPSNGVWYLQRSTQGFTGVVFGANGDIPMPADFDGDGKADLAVFRPSNGVWYIQQSSNGFVGISFGANGDVPVVADYDGDGKADIAVFRPSNGTWYLQRSGLGFTGVVFGTSGDKPVAADYDADGKADIAVFRSSNGVWYLQQSTAGFNGISFGANGDVPVPADYDGDGKADISVFRPSNGVWYLNRSTQGFTGVVFGTNGDKPAPNAFIP